MRTLFKAGGLAVSAALAFVSTPVHAHAFLDHAVPGVGSTVSGAPAELQLSFTEGVVVALSGVKVASVGGAAVAVAKPIGDPSDPNVLRVRLEKALRAGTYVVTWHVVSVDSHPTSGTFKFTVAP
jgi:methionine-rich copper-binding protein CopC